MRPRPIIRRTERFGLPVYHFTTFQDGPLAEAWQPQTKEQTPMKEERNTPSPRGAQPGNQNDRKHEPGETSTIYIKVPRALKADAVRAGKKAGFANLTDYLTDTVRKRNKRELNK